MTTLVNYKNVFAWNSQSNYYPIKGEGIQYFKGSLNEDVWVDCLLYYGEDNTLQGILNYYPFSWYPYERKGNVNIQVRIDKRRQGIATTLLNVGISRFKIDLKKQDYTPLGKQFIRKYLESYKIR
jgi:hypothetical protein